MNNKKATGFEGWEVRPDAPVNVDPVPIVSEAQIEEMKKAGWVFESSPLDYCPCCSVELDFTPDRPTFCKACAKDHYE